jgi:NAD(P)-dependent dehydrogenase (short-subunit alcohol dehydrogenase family)
MGVFTDKAFLVVGGGRGIGRATALALARHGARVVIDDLGCDANGEGHDPNVATEVAAEVRSEGGQALAFSHDARKREAPQQLVEACIKEFGGIHGGLYCAGFTRERPLLRMTDDDFDGVLDVHLRGAFRFTRELGRALVDQRQGGSIVLASSTAAFFGSASQASAAAAAGAVASLARTAATELRRQGVRVNCVVPTARTRLTEHLPLFRSIKADSLSAEHVANVICHLLSDAAQDVHGELVGVAGGRTYAFRMSETSGLFREGPPVEWGELAASWREVTRT